MVLNFFDHPIHGIGRCFTMEQGEEKIQTQVTSEVVTKIRDQFRQADTSGTGSLSKSELKAVFTKLGFKPSTDEDFEQLFNSVDANDDGEIEFDEFLFFLFNERVDDKALQIAREFKSRWDLGETQLEEPQQMVERVEQTPLYIFLCKQLELSKGFLLPKNSQEEVAEYICSLSSQATASVEVADADKYTNALSVLAAVMGEDVVLLRGSWVKSTDCTRILKRGDTAYPKDAYISGEELCKIYQSGRTPQLPIIAISHFW